jgi:flagellar M-ring protein FliF
LPQSSVIGYEIFDKQSLGTTSYVQKVNRKRALEGELMRTINTIQGVKRSRVHLALPEKSTFVEDQKRATASVVVDLDPGTVLGEKQVFGIGTMVSRAVEGLEIADVSIMDSQGKVLSKQSRDPMVAMTGDQVDFKLKFEDDKAKSIENMFARIIGEGRAVAKVSAEFDFSQVNETQTIFDQDGLATRSVQKNAQSMEGSRPSPVGPAGAASNLPGQTPLESAQVKNDTKKTYETINYEVPSTLRQTRKAAGSLKKLSIAVVVDGKQTKVTDKDGKVQAKTEPWTPEKLKEFEGLVANAMGLDRKRGDSIEIRNMEFTREDFDEAQRLLESTERRSYYQNLAIYIVAGLIIVFFFLFVVRPFIQWVTENTIDGVDSFLPQTIEELEKFQKNVALPGLEDTMPVLPDRIDPAKVEGEMIKEKVTTLVDTNPHKAALVLRDWIRDDGKKKDKKGGGDDKSKTA